MADAEFHAACGSTHMPLSLGGTVARQHDGAAAHRGAIRARDEEADVRLQQRRKRREVVALAG